METSERLTWAEIRKRYPDQHVVLVDGEWGEEEGPEPVTAIVLGHYNSRKEASPHVKAALARGAYTEVGSMWTGELRLPLTPWWFPR
jgi:hypothetical protein